KQVGGLQPVQQALQARLGAPRQRAFAGKRGADVADMRLQFRRRVGEQGRACPQGELHGRMLHVGTSIMGLRGARLAPPNKLTLVLPLVASWKPKPVEPRSA